MKNQLRYAFLVVGLGLVLAAPQLAAQSLKGMSLNGATGLMSIPSGRIGWEHSADLGFDLGYHAIFDDGDTAHIPKASLSLFKLAEVSFAYDTNTGDDNEDILIGGKIQLPTGRTAVAVGGNVHARQRNDNSRNSQQVYLAATYPGSFFGMPAETTMVVGKTFGDDGPGEEAIDFGMGFDLQLFPDVFQGYVHWINDFGNFSYSLDAVGANARDRGVFNTGIRIDIAANPALSRYKFVIDAMLTDALDENRAFALGLAFGAPIL
ncbi:MAG: hypothetical protein EA428_02980 [Spirochaetaceae bacterium]|nr:MAG: hypothetical protein EA428_02980 [Spirochaetaceae bacterium]